MQNKRKIWNYGNDQKRFLQAQHSGRRVLIIAFDGIRVDAFHQADIPNVKSLVASGSASFATRDVMPSVTLPNFTSHLTGAGPEVHGVADNSWTGEVPFSVFSGKKR